MQYYIKKVFERSTFSLIKRYTKEVPELTECDWNITITADPANIIQDKAFRIDFEIHVFQNRIVWIIQEHFRSFPKISSI